MGLDAGTRLGSYEVTGPLGAGGMGEVYRARDHKLDRNVALKILPEAFASDAERLARFDREAKALAALNHPNIAQIYGVEDSTSIRALVMELVDGDTLADRIGGAEAQASALRVDEALDFAKQIADALQAAHEQGIIHRDLKPANVKVRPDGTIKVLDFGLAKLTNEASEASGAGRVDGAGGLAGLTNSPTLTLGATQAGIILGTAAYMSPEQAKGRAADKRSDIWAFGCVLYEMLTGRRAFDGDDASDTLASVLKAEPDWNALPADVTPAVRTLIQRCLVKDPRRRVADISVAQFVLAEAASLDQASASQGDSAPSEGDERKAASRVHPAILVSAAALVTAVVAAAAGWTLWPSSPSAAITRFTFPLGEDAQLTATGRQLVAISPDGGQFVYVANNRLYVRSLSEFGSRAIPGAEWKEGVSSPVFSPDGANVAFHSMQALKQVPVGGGAPVTVCAIETPYGLTWDASGLIAGQGRFGIVRCPSNGGPPEQLVKVDQVAELAHGPQLLPGGDALLFTLAKASDSGDRWEKAQVVVESLTSHTRKIVLDGASDAKYLPTGHLIYAIGGDLFASRFDLATQSLVGRRMAVLEGVRRTLNATTGAAHAAISGTGTLVYIPGAPGRTTSERTIAKASRSGTVTPLTLRTGTYIHVRATRDGARLALDTDDGKEANIWIYEMDGKSDVNRLTFGGKNRFPIWSPDGQRVAFQSDREGDLAIWTQRIDGTAIERLTKPETGEAHVPESWSPPDGAFIAFAVVKEGTRPTHDLRVLSLADKKVAPFGDVRSFGEPIGAVFSPDGRWIAYHSRTRSGVDGSSTGIQNDSRDVGIFVQSFPATGLKYQAPKMSIDFQPVWSAKGDELFYVPLAASGQIAAVQVTRTGSGIRFGTPQRIPARVNAGRTSGSTRAFDMLPDGQFVGPISSSEEAALATAASSSEIRVVVNWFEELQQKLPVER